MIFVSRYFHLSFNPRTRTGCDGDVMPRTDEYLGFNPRTRTGCDVLATFAESFRC